MSEPITKCPVKNTNAINQKWSIVKKLAQIAKDAFVTNGQNIAESTFADAYFNSTRDPMDKPGKIILESINEDTVLSINGIVRKEQGKCDAEGNCVFAIDYDQDIDVSKVNPIFITGITTDYQKVNPSVFITKTSKDGKFSYALTICDDLLLFSMI